MEPPRCSWPQEGHVDVATALLEHNADPNQATTDEHGYTPLIVAVQFGQLEVVAALLAGNADLTLSSTDASQWTPLSIAVDERHAAIAKLLRQHGATA